MQWSDHFTKSPQSHCVLLHARFWWVARSSAEHCRPTCPQTANFWQKSSTESEFPSETQSLAVQHFDTELCMAFWWHSGPQKDLDHELLDTAAQLEPRPIQADGHTVAKLSVGWCHSEDMWRISSGWNLGALPADPRRRKHATNRKGGPWLHNSSAKAGICWLNLLTCSNCSNYVFNPERCPTVQKAVTQFPNQSRFHHVTPETVLS